VVDCCLGHLSGDEIVKVLPEQRGEAVECTVVGSELGCVEERSDPRVSLSVLDGAECFAECEFSEYCLCQALESDIKQWTEGYHQM
jgi:hypothetical protein